MINSEEIQQLLKKTKLTSLGDVISFIFEHLHRVVNLDPLHQISMRLSQLEKDKGLDKIMIQEVKTLVQAIFQQKQDYMKRDIEKAVHHNLSATIEQEQTRRSLGEMDFMQMLNVQQNRKPSFGGQIKTESFQRQISELRVQLEKKADRKDIFDLRNCVHKEISGKMSIKQTERIVEKFEKEVFEKLNESGGKFQKMEISLKKNINQEMNKIKEEITENLKSKEYKSILGKMEKKMKKCLELSNQANSFTQTQIKEINQQISSNKQENYQQFEQLCQLIETVNSSTQKSEGVWVAQEQVQKNKAISWTKEFSNTDKENYMFENKKSQILVVKPGYYRVQCLVEGCQNPPALIVNSLEYQKFKGKGQNYQFSEIMNMTDNRSVISIKLEGSIYSCALVKISKL